MEQEPKTEIEPQPEVKMPDGFIEPEGKSGRWSEVVEDKDLGVLYREKVIELPKERREETGIKKFSDENYCPLFQKVCATLLVNMRIVVGELLKLHLKFGVQIKNSMRHIFFNQWSISSPWNIRPYNKL